MVTAFIYQKLPLRGLKCWTWQSLKETTINMFKELNYAILTEVRVKIDWQFLKKLNIDLPFFTQKFTLRYIPNIIEIEYSNISTQIFIATLITAIQRWKQPICPSPMNQYTKCGMSIQ